MQKEFFFQDRFAPLLLFGLFSFGCLQNRSADPAFVLLGNPIGVTVEDLNSPPAGNPPTLTYATSSFQFVKNIPISLIQPTVSGVTTSFSISPALPSGLSFDSTNGEITGNPTAKHAASSYTITASNAGGSSSSSIQIEVDAFNADWESFLKAPNPDINDPSGGFDLDLSGDTLVLGMCGEDSAQTAIVHSPFAGLTSAGDDDSASAAGAAYVFRRSGTTWALEAYLKAPNAETNDQFGCAVAISGDTIVVGARAEDSGNSAILHSPFTGLTPAGDDDSLVSPGAAYVYRRSGTTWALEAYLKAPNADAGDQFGGSVSISGDRIAVGAALERGGLGTIIQSPAPGFTGATDNDSAAASGAVYIFERTGTTWAWNAYIKAPNPDPNDSFGGRIKLRGDTLIVGAVGEDGGVTTIQNSLGPSLTPAGDDDSLATAGAVYVFRKTGATWAFESYLKAPNADNSDQFGSSVSLSEDGNVAVVGVYNEDSAQTTISNSLGPSLTTAGDDDSSNSAGAVYVFRRTGATWAFEAYLKSPNIEANDNFGRSVSISGDMIVVGANGEDSSQVSILHSPLALPGPGADDDTVSSSGAAYVFRKLSSGWAFQSYLKAPNAEASDALGILVCIDEDLIAVAAQNDDDGLGMILNRSLGPPPTSATDDDSVSNSGAVHIFYK